MRASFTTSLILAAAPVAIAQFPPTPEGVAILKSKFHENPGICETTPGVKSYSGYVHLPPGLLSDIAGEDQPYPINTFFWFFEARKDPANAPLSIWLNGGPGGSSAMGLLQENGPCFVGNDSNSTYLNPWSWNNEVNMLYLDQPTQVGYSYDVLINGTKDTSTGVITIGADFSDGVPKQNNTFLVGTFPSQNSSLTANSTVHAAHAFWHFAQTWFEEFPFYKPTDEKVSLWTESYGGHYGPGFIKFFQQQNEKIANGTISGPLGIINGGIDFAVQMVTYLEMAYNNTYNIQAINQTQYEAGIHDYFRPGGCADKVVSCRKAVRDMDPDDRGDVDDANKLCSDAFDFCFPVTLGPYFNSSTEEGYGWYDIAHPKADPFPEPYLAGFLNQHWVQAALGVPVNHSAHSEAVSDAFSSTGDWFRGGFSEAMGYLLDSGVKVAGMYGDRDMACNWLGGEVAFLNVPYSRQEDFNAAGYAPILSGGEEKGQVRQLGNFSFSRVYQAGHEVPSYQPQAAYDIFMRATFNKDISTGLVPATSEFRTEGPATTFHIKNGVPEKPEPVCYILNPRTCTEEQFAQVMNGTVKVKDWLVVEYDAHDTTDVAREEADGELGAGIEGDLQRVLDPALTL
ncbi:hypothetical protein BP6252_11259 [Coleophoma cylindrospora]|uniref:Carboxypeptidase n=1 Tax=Coleophoma cylindrospora TaxID=1849047 RepID=A0A3D8QQF8_9HELO|nr:hypothetical protein BP6252_11259 [Coleophoma cylindrospora]